MFVKQKSVTPTFDYLIGGGLTFGDLMVFSIFWFDEGLFIWLPRLPLLLGLHGLLHFVIP
jgi:hypothetical protein